MENVALVEYGFIEKSLKIEKLASGNYKISAQAIPTSNQKSEKIEMEFTQAGFNALVGTWGIFAT